MVDDYEPFRRFVCSTLANSPEFRVIGEASDGLDAVRKAEELQPDLIVLDIGLPTLNGLDAARRIREVCPESKILCLTQESSADVAREALSLGVLGYVVKIHAGTELLDAVDAVRQGRQFVSSGLSGQNFTDKEDSQAHDRQSHSEALTSVVPGEGKSSRRHEVQFNSDDASFLVGITRFIEAALEAGKAVLVVATESHRKSFLHRLQAHGVEVATAIEEGRYIALDAAEALSTFMVNGLPDRVRFLTVMSDLIATAAKTAKGERLRVAACGECAPLLWAQGRAEAAIQLEHLWDEFAQKNDVDILCGYVLNNSQRERESHIYERICEEHSAVYS